MKDTYYYDCLEVKPDASTADIRKSYYRLAMRYHPDKNLSAPAGERAALEAKFKAVNDAYQVLSDPSKRSLYDTHGREATQAGEAFMDPREVFKMVFGGEAFVDIIGELSFVQILEGAMEEQEGASSGNRLHTNGQPGSAGGMTPEQREAMKRQRVLRISRLSAKLIDKLALYVEGNYTKGEFEEYAKKEADNLKHESFGPELLHSVGYVYSMRAKTELGRDSFLGLSSFYHSVKEKGHIVGQLVNTVSTAREVMVDEQQRQRKAEAAIKSNNINEDAMSDVDEAKLKKLMFQMASLEVESVLREVCDVVLAGRYARKRAEALKILGDAYRKHVPPLTSEARD